MKTKQDKEHGVDTEWKAGDPYPTWPFTRVRPEELAKHIRKQQPDDEALL